MSANEINLWRKEFSPPPEPEKTDRNAESSNETRWQSFFRLNVTILVELWLQDEIQVAEIWRDDHHSSDEDT